MMRHRRTPLFLALGLLAQIIVHPAAAVPPTDSEAEAPAEEALPPMPPPLDSSDPAMPEEISDESAEDPVKPPEESEESASIPEENLPLDTAADEGDGTPPETDTPLRTEGRLGNSSERPFDSERPWLGIQLTGSARTFGSDDPFNGGEGADSQGVSALVEIMPTPIQDIGVFSFGPSVAVYPVAQNLNGEYRTPSFASIYSYGGLIRYQFRYFRNQIVVPMIGYAAEMMKYHLSPVNNQTEVKGDITLSGPLGGLWILLNPFEPSAASDLYANSGILRSYLALEARNLEGVDDNIEVGGTSFYFGVRLEL